MSNKYPRSYHLPWSLGASNDDKMASDISKIINHPIIISEKADGSNACLERRGCFARTHASAPTHPSFDHLKALHAMIKYQIPEHIQLFGENVFAKHSIEYSALPGYFLLFNVRDLSSNQWLSWEDVEDWAQRINIPTVPVLFKGILNEPELKKLTEKLMEEPSMLGGIREGIVVRTAASFTNQDFSTCLLKMVRQNHITTSTHWAYQKISQNKLIKKEK